MIEGIVGLFVILLSILVVPYIKDYFKKETISYKVFPDEPSKPNNGDMWHSFDDDKYFALNDGKWEVIDGPPQPPQNPKAGDIWLY